MGASQYIGCDGLIGAHRVGAMEHGNAWEDEIPKARRHKVEADVLGLLRQGYSTDYVGNRLGLSHGVIYGIRRRHGLVGGRDAHRTSKIKAIHKPESALDYVDDIRIMRGPDAESGEQTYIASVNDDAIIGHVCGTVAGAINDVMRQVKEPEK